MQFKIFTLFPKCFPGTLGLSVIGRALNNKIWHYETINIRDYATDKHKNIDDYPYGGGAGMIMRADVIGNAIESNIKNFQKELIICFSAKGKKLNQNIVTDIVQNYNSISLVCPRFEGIDQRAIEEYKMHELSIGNYILSGGEVAAMVLMECVIRKIPGVMNNCESDKEESFAAVGEFQNLPEYPQYTKPNIWKNHQVPEILLSGNHQKIKEWRLAKAKEQVVI